MEIWSWSYLLREAADRLEEDAFLMRGAADEIERLSSPVKITMFKGMRADEAKENSFKSLGWKAV